MSKIYLALLACLLSLSGCTSFNTVLSDVVELDRIDNGVVTGGGTGFVVAGISGKPYILTNRHMCDDLATNIHTKHEPLPLRVIQVSTTTDLCLLEAPAGLTAHPLHLARHKLRAREHATIVGYGMLMGETVSDGQYVCPIGMSILGVTHPDYYTATILPGNSGSPVLNDSNEVVGVAFASGGMIANRALAVSLQDVKQFLSFY